jgi:RNA polymerase sigma-70 factor (ECF subfamily)
MTPLLAQRPRSDRAFERIYKRHVGDVYRYALAVMRNQADAEDVTQTTFLNAYRALVEKGDRPEKPQNWLIAIAHNVCRQRFRQSARRPSEVAFEDDIADAIPEDEAPTGEDIRRALGHLAFNQRAALVMRELEGRSYAEIAEILGLSTSAVETLIFRARRALREQLEGSLTCGGAEFAISRQLDGTLPRQERGQLRAHLRECPECAAFARRQRAQRGALKSLALVPVPGSLGSFFGGGGAAVGTGLGLKAVAAVTAGVVIGGASVATVRHTHWTSHPATYAAPVVRSPSPSRIVPARAKQFVPHGRMQVAGTSRPNAHAHARALEHRKQANGNSSSHRAAHVKKHAHPVPPAAPRRARPRAGRLEAEAGQGEAADGLERQRRRERQRQEAVSHRKDPARQRVCSSDAPSSRLRGPFGAPEHLISAC